MPRECIFCGNTQLSGEHIFAEWLRKITARVLPPTATARFVADTPREEREWPGMSFPTTVRKVCHRCNNTWMSDLENDAKNVLVSLMFGREQVLTIHDQQRLALWCVKTAIVMNAVRPVEGIPLAHARFIYEHKSLPKNYAITICTSRFEQPYLLLYHQSVGFQPPHRGS